MPSAAAVRLRAAVKTLSKARHEQAAQEKARAPPKIPIHQLYMKSLMGEEGATEGAAAEVGVKLDMHKIGSKDQFALWSTAERAVGYKHLYR
eukprot:949868-Rhodomonas_salina.3